MSLDRNDFERWLRYGRERSWLNDSRARDFVSAWDNESDEGVMRDEPGARPDFSGVGPKNYKRSDDAIEDEVFNRLTHHPDLDASDIEIEVKDTNVFLKGFVDNKFERRLAEDIVADVAGVGTISNELKFKQFGFRSQ